MSELLSAEDDPDPSGCQEYLPYGPYDVPYNGLRAYETTWVEMYEPENVTALCGVAESILQDDAARVGDEESCRLTREGASLGRQLVDDRDNFFFVITSPDGPSACYSWSKGVGLVNYCIVEGDSVVDSRYVASHDVAVKLQDIFIQPPTIDKGLRRQLGGIVLAKLRRVTSLLT